MRPRTLAEFVGQASFLGRRAVIAANAASGRIGSVVFYGPPGTGKTSLAELIAQHVQAKFQRLNAAASGVKELREHLEKARQDLETGGSKTVLFIDELHRFNRAQQDVLLPDVEAGVISLIGATTANPFFSLVAPLVSRSQIFEFQAISREDIRQLLQRAISDESRGMGKYRATLTEEALELSGGDLRWRCPPGAECVGNRGAFHPGTRHGGCGSRPGIDSKKGDSIRWHGR